MFINAQYPPDSWQYFVKRQDNLGLPIQTLTQKYLTEQMMYDNQFMHQQNMMNTPGASQPSSSPSRTPTGNEIWNETPTPYDGAFGSWDGII